VTRAGDIDEEALVGHALELIAALQELVPHWLDRSIRLRAGFDVARTPDVIEATQHALEALRANELTDLRKLLETDIDQQRLAPMAILRAAVRHPTGVLEIAGVPHHRRDEFEVTQFPDDHYSLTPATWADVHPDLHGPGIAWGAAKAFVHLARRKAEGQR